MQIRCTNCGADVPIGASTTEVICSYCNAALFVGRQTGIAHLVMSGYVSFQDAVFRLGRFLAQKEVTSKIRVLNSAEFYFPFWQLPDGRGKKSVLWAARTALTESAESIPMMSGETDKQTPMDVADHLLWEPELLLEDVAGSAGVELSDTTGTNRTVSLVHIPFYKIEYFVHGETLTAFVDKVSGQVFADELPASPQQKKSIVLAGVSLGALLVVVAQVFFLPGILQLLTIPLSLVGLHAGISKILSQMGW
ncbi:MAG: hypothetical protein JXX29_12445 [Deltaproteobacteria bacterium]|nr:hypothetical protein [Deltaproteobacteria bacterium]MBN2672484.1 hypothetical protein [Deltaproteobacteria bacterium]